MTVLPDFPGAPSAPGAPGAPAGPCGPGTGVGTVTTAGLGAGLGTGTGTGWITVFSVFCSQALSPSVAATIAADSTEYFISFPFYLL